MPFGGPGPTVKAFEKLGAAAITGVRVLLGPWKVFRLEEHREKSGRNLAFGAVLPEKRTSWGEAGVAVRRDLALGQDGWAVLRRAANQEASRILAPGRGPRSREVHALGGLEPPSTCWRCTAYAESDAISMHPGPVWRPAQDPYEQTLLLLGMLHLRAVSADCQTPETRMDRGLHRISEAYRVKDGAVATDDPTPVRQHGHRNEGIHRDEEQTYAWGVRGGL
jgi:hypothetical protein